VAPEIQASLREILRRPVTSHKYDFGHVLVVGGSPGMVGAPFLSARAALRIGAGLVTIAGSPEVIDKLEERVEEVMTLRLPAEPDGELTDFINKRKVSVAVVGPGMRPKAALTVVKQLLNAGLALVIDGGALSALRDNLNLLTNHDKLVLTPHAAEFQRLIKRSSLPKDQAGLLRLAESFTRKYGITLVLKGHPTRVIDQQEIYENNSGGPALATAGTGDVLAGMIGGLMAQGLEPAAAAKAAVYAHGLAGDLAAKTKTEPGVIASDIIELIPRALKSAA
jgi:NAD(P)H-hydrate epimerase